MKLNAWIAENGGQSAIARKLGVSRQLVNSWLKTGWAPRLDHAVKIVHESKGKVTFDDLIELAGNRKKKAGKRC